MHPLFERTGADGDVEFRIGRLNTLVVAGIRKRWESQKDHKTVSGAVLLTELPVLGRPVR